MNKNEGNNKTTSKNNLMEENSEKKYCPQCNSTKDISKFTMRQGKLHPWCKECKNRKERERRALVRDEINARERKAYNNKKEMIEKIDIKFDKNEMKECTNCGNEKSLSEFLQLLT